MIAKDLLGFHKLLKLGVEELRRTVCEQEPLSPSAKLKTLKNEELTKTARRRQIEPPRLQSELRGDLDWIVLKCLEKDRTRRYATANALAMDIHRYSHEEAVLARPPSRLYRLQKLVRRNRIVFLAGAVAAAALLLGTITSTLMFFEERQARASEARLRREAELRAKASRVASLVTQGLFENADTLVAGLPLNKPSIEVAAELRALGDWHATAGRWHQATERFGSLVKVDELDDPYLTSMDQCKLAAALLKAGDRRGYEQWRQSMAARLKPAVGPLPNSLIKACLLLPAESNMLQLLVAASEADTTRNPSAAGIHPPGRHRVTSSDAMVLFDYRRGDFTSITPENPMGIPPRIATIDLIRAMELWQLKDYWGAMIEWTKGYALVQAGARQGEVTLTVRSEIFPGVSEPEYLEAPWFDWVVAGILMGEWNEMVGEAERSFSRVTGGTPSLEQIALTRAVGEWHALRGEWSDALRCSQSCLQSNQADSLDHATMDYLNAAIACLELGDENGYLRLREAMASRFKDPDNGTAERSLAVGLMQSLDDRTAARLEPLAALLARTSASGNEPALYLGLLEYRRGYYEKAMEWANRSLSKFSGVAQPNAMARVILAMSLAQLGNRSAAHLELEHAKNLIETGFNLQYDMWHWRDWVLVRLLLHDAEALIAPAPVPVTDAAAR